MRRPLPRVRLKQHDSGADRHGASDLVGYRKPPREHTWKPGQSGNLRGRPRGSKNESTILREIVQHKIAIRGSTGRLRKISVLEGIHRKIAEDALKGNIKSAGFILNRYAAMVSGELQRTDLGDEDREVLEAFAERLARRPDADASDE